MPGSTEHLKTLKARVDRNPKVIMVGAGAQVDNPILHRAITCDPLVVIGHKSNKRDKTNDTEHHMVYLRKED